MRSVDRKSNDCWVWIGSVDGGGYGICGRGRDLPRRAHRASWVLHRGAIPDGLYVLHRCDTPRCVNPDHLFLGDARINAHDCIAKGRKVAKARLFRPLRREGQGIPRGSARPRAKLTEAIVAEMRARRAAGETVRSLAREFCVHSVTALRAIRGDGWTHVGAP